MTNISHTSIESESVKKPKIPTTNRIRVALGRVVYCSSKILQDEELKQLLMRTNQVMSIKKGESDAVRKRLRELLDIYPDHFMTGSKAVIIDLWPRGY